MVIVMTCGIGSIICCIKEMKTSINQDNGFFAGNPNFNSGNSSPETISYIDLIPHDYNNNHNNNNNNIDSFNNQNKNKKYKIKNKNKNKKNEKKDNNNILNSKNNYQNTKKYLKHFSTNHFANKKHELRERQNSRHIVIITSPNNGSPNNGSPISGINSIDSITNINDQNGENGEISGNNLASKHLQLKPGQSGHSLASHSGNTIDSEPSPMSFINGDNLTNVNYHNFSDYNDIYREPGQIQAPGQLQAAGGIMNEEAPISHENNSNINGNFDMNNNNINSDNNGNNKKPAKNWGRAQSLEQFGHKNDDHVQSASQANILSQSAIVPNNLLIAGTRSNSKEFGVNCDIYHE